MFRSPLLSERADPGLRQVNKVVVPHANFVAVRSGVEDNRLIGGQRLIDVHRQVIKRTERRLSRSEEHTSELQSRQYLVCRLLLEKKKKKDMRKDVRQQGTWLVDWSMEGSPNIHSAREKAGVRGDIRETRHAMTHRRRRTRSHLTT